MIATIIMHVKLCFVGCAGAVVKAIKNKAVETGSWIIKVGARSKNTNLPGAKVAFACLRFADWCALVESGCATKMLTLFRKHYTINKD